MSYKVFQNEILDQWLDSKTEEILLKIEKKPLTSEELLILSLKAQTNHFHHMDIEFRKEFFSINGKFREIDKQFRLIEQRFEKIDQRFEKIDQRFEKIDQRFEILEAKFDKKFEIFEEKIDKKFDRFAQIMMWGFGTMIACFMGVFFELLKH